MQNDWQHAEAPSCFIVFQDKKAKRFLVFVINGRPETSHFNFADADFMARG